MKTFRVQYTVKSDFVPGNKKNTEAVMRELRALNNNDLRYAQYLHEDGKTFMHLVHYNTTDSENVLPAVASFKHFRARLEGQFEVPPKTETFEIVHSFSADLLTAPFVIMRAQARTPGFRPAFSFPPRLKPEFSSIRCARR